MNYSCTSHMTRLYGHVTNMELSYCWLTCYFASCFWYWLLQPCCLLGLVPAPDDDDDNGSNLLRGSIPDDDPNSV